MNSAPLTVTRDSLAEMDAHRLVASRALEACGFVGHAHSLAALPAPRTTGWAYEWVAAISLAACYATEATLNGGKADRALTRAASQACWRVIACFAMTAESRIDEACRGSR